MITHERKQFRRVGRLPDDLEPRSVEQAGKPFTQKYVVVGNDDSQRTHHGPSRAGSPGLSQADPSFRICVKNGE